MRYRALSPTGDYVFGQGTTEFLVNSPAAVAQAVQTRLRLATGEYFLDLEEGTPYAEQILGEGTLQTYDLAIRDRILGTPGVISIDDYASVLDGENRSLIVVAEISTEFGTVTIQQAL